MGDAATDNATGGRRTLAARCALQLLLLLQIHRRSGIGQRAGGERQIGTLGVCQQATLTIVRRGRGGTGQRFTLRCLERLLGQGVGRCTDTGTTACILLQ